MLEELLLKGRKLHSIITDYLIVLNENAEIFKLKIEKNYTKKYQKAGKGTENAENAEMCT